ncbi:MAG: response regulator transcription factor [Epsilonproteobacteria bacterium]|nr:response regulator transcription factor [Campylobacterota bacterium]
MRVLILEDDTILADSLKDILEDEGIQTDIANNADEAYELTFNNKYDLYIFDINLPDENGIEVLKNLKRADDTTPTIFLTALTDIKTISKAFESGAIDYIKKPFDIEEFLIRVKSKLKTNSLTYKDLSIDLENNIVKKGENIISLGSTQQNLITALIKNRGKVVPKDELLEFLEHSNENALRVAINKLKTKLGIDIKSIRGKGYIVE